MPQTDSRSSRWRRGFNRTGKGRNHSCLFCYRFIFEYKWTTDCPVGFLYTRINKEKGTAIVMVTHNRQIFEKYPGRVMVCKDEVC